MKKLLSLISLACMAQPALAAGNISNLNINQADFRALSEDLSSTISYKPVMPTEALGATGFDMGIEVTQTEMAKTANSKVWNTITNGSSGSVSNLYVPKLHIDKGLPFGIDVALVYSKIPTTNISLIGGEVRYALVDGGMATPAVGLRVAMTKLSGVSVLSMDTKSADISVSKGFTVFKPYIGLGQVWTNSTPNGNFSLVKESFTQGKVFGGLNLNLGATNFCLEYDKTGSAASTSLKIGFRW